jgi:hypothetical protein
LQQAAVKVLRGAGLNDSQIAEAWHGGGPLRTTAGQVLLARAAAWDLAQARAREVRQAPVPPVQRPGVAGQMRSNGNLDQVRELKAQLKTAKGNSALRLGAELVKAQRKLAGGR